MAYFDDEPSPEHWRTLCNWCHQPIPVSPTEGEPCAAIELVPYRLRHDAVPFYLAPGQFDVRETWCKLNEPTVKVCITCWTENVRCSRGKSKKQEQPQ